jgi:uncharacterized damage-inducible protein DinB
MRQVGSVFIGVIVLLAIVGNGAADAQDQGRGQGRPGGDGRAGGRGRGPAPVACTTLACDVQQDHTRTRELIINVADAMPADKYSFKPTPAQRSFAEQLMHIIEADTGLLGSIGPKTPAPTINKQASSKADVMAALTQAYDYTAAVVKEFNDQQLNERVMSMPFFGPTASRAKVIYYDLQHTQDIYGQLVVYLRLNGVTPPASRRGGV